MFENIKNRIKDIYYNIYTRRYMRTRQKNTNGNDISVDVLPEEVKYKILQKGLIIEPKEEVYAIIASIHSEEYRNEMIEKYISINNETPIEEILKIPESLRIQCLKNNQLIQFDPKDVVKLLKSTANANMYQLLLNDSSIVNYLNKKTTFYYSKYSPIEDSLWYYLYQRISQIEDNELKTAINQLINIEDLAKKIDSTIVSNEELAIQNIDLLIDKHSKIDLLLKIFLKREKQTIFLEKYRELSEEVQQQILSKLFSAEYVEQLEEIYEEQIKQKKYREIDFGELLQQYSFKEKIDQELLIKLFKINQDSNSFMEIAEGRNIIISLLEDENKAKVLCDLDKFDIPGMSIRWIKVLKLFNQIEDKKIFVNALNTFIKNFEQEKKTNHWQISIEKYIKEIDDQQRLAIIQNQNLPDETGMLLISLSLSYMGNDYLKEALKCKIISSDYFYEVKDIIWDKIFQYGNTNELLKETEVSTTSNLFAFILLLNADKEEREDFLKKHENVHENIIYILNNKFDEIRKLIVDIDNPIDLKTFLTQVIEEDVEKLDRKFEILLSLQERNSQIATTAKLPMLEEDIIEAFGGIENLEILLRYPETQKYLLQMDTSKLKITALIYDVLKENLNNPNYLFDEMLKENGRGYSLVYDKISKFLTKKKGITEEEKEDIVNILLSNNIIKDDNELYNKLKVKDYKKFKAEYCDSIINGKKDSKKIDITTAYLLRYYNLSKEEAEIRVQQYEKFIDSLDDTEETIPIKNYINALKNVLSSNQEILAIAYELSKDQEEISRLDIEIMEEKIREIAGKEIKNTLFKPESKEKSDTIQVMLEDNEVEVSIYEPGEEFNMLVHVLDAYGGGDGKYLDYNKQWNTKKYASNQRICTSYIGNNNMLMVTRYNCVIYGFNNFADGAVVKEAPYDIISKNNELVTRTIRDALFLMPKDLINTTRVYNEVDIEREDLNNRGQKLQPSYIVCFGKCKEDVNEESKKAAAQFGIPIVLIDREKYAKKEMEKIERELEEFKKTSDPQLVTSIIEEYCNNKAGAERSVREKKEKIKTNLEEFFSDSRLNEIIDIFLDVADKEKDNGNIEKSASIIQFLHIAIKKEEKKDFLWQKQFGTELLVSPFEGKIFREVMKKMDERLLRLKEDINIQEFIEKIDNENTQEEWYSQEEKLPPNSNDIDKLKTNINNLSPEEKKYLEGKNEKWAWDPSWLLKEKLEKVYALLLSKDLKLEKISSKILSECMLYYGKKEVCDNEKHLKEKFSEEEIKLIKALSDTGLGRNDEEEYQELISEYNISEDLQDEFIKAKKILNDAGVLAYIAVDNKKSKVYNFLYQTEEAKYYIKTALQIQESIALRKIYTIIEQEGYGNQVEKVFEYLKKGRTPIELAQSLHEVSKKEIINGVDENGER